jgi:adenylate cyclase
MPAATETLWGEQYDRKMSDLVGVQQDISSAISARLREQLSGDAVKTVVKGGTSDPEAYQLFLKGNFYFEKRTRESLEKARVYLNQAIEKDPTYAQAWAILAAVYYVEPDYAPISNAEDMPKARAAAEKALAIDDSLALPHAVLGGILNSSFEWQASEREFRRAIELNPKDPNTHNWYAFLLSQLGRHSEAIVQARQALELEPLNPKYGDTLGSAYRESGQNDLAIEEFKKTLEIDPNYQSALMNLALTYFNIRQYDLWLKAWEAATKTSNDPEMLAIIAEASQVYAKSGYLAAARKVADLELELSKHRYFDPAILAFDYAEAGENDKAFALLDKAYAEKSDALVWIKTEARATGLHSDPRYARLLQKMGFPQ